MQFKRIKRLKKLYQKRPWLFKKKAKESRSRKTRKQNPLMWEKLEQKSLS